MKKSSGSNMARLNKMKEQNHNNFTLSKDESNVDEENDDINELNYLNPYNNVLSHKLMPRESPFSQSIKHRLYMSNNDVDNYSPNFGTPEDKYSENDYYKHNKSLLTPPVYSNFLSGK